MDGPYCGYCFFRHYTYLPTYHYLFYCFLLNITQYLLQWSFTNSQSEFRNFTNLLTDKKLNSEHGISNSWNYTLCGLHEIFGLFWIATKRVILKSLARISAIFRNHNYYKKTCKIGLILSELFLNNHLETARCWAGFAS